MNKRNVYILEDREYLSKIVRIKICADVFYICLRDEEYNWIDYGPDITGVDFVYFDSNSRCHLFYANDENLFMLFCIKYGDIVKFVKI